MRCYAVPAYVLIALLAGCTQPITRITATRCDLANSASDGESVALACDLTHRGAACQAVYRVDILDGRQHPIRSTNRRYENQHGFVAAGKTVLLAPDEPAQTIAVVIPVRELEATADVLPAWAQYGLYEPGGATITTELARLPARVQRAALRAALGSAAEPGPAVATEPAVLPPPEATPSAPSSAVADVAPQELDNTASLAQDTAARAAVPTTQQEPLPRPQVDAPAPSAVADAAAEPGGPPPAEATPVAAATQPVARPLKALRSFLYTVRRGDTLSGLAQRFYLNAARWEDIYAQNMDVLESPDRLREGMVLEIPLDDDTSP